ASSASGAGAACGCVSAGLAALAGGGGVCADAAQQGMMTASKTAAAKRISGARILFSNFIRYLASLVSDAFRRFMVARSKLQVCKYPRADARHQHFVLGLGHVVADGFVEQLVGDDPD